MTDDQLFRPTASFEVFIRATFVFRAYGAGFCRDFRDFSASLGIVECESGLGLLGKLIIISVLV